MEIVSALLNDNNRVTKLIVADAEWATATYGGRWVQFVRDEPGKTYPTYGAEYVEETHDFVNPPIVVPE